MQGAGDPRAAGFDHAVGGQFLAGLEHHRGRQRRGVEIVRQRAVGPLRAPAHPVHVRLQDFALFVEQRHQTVGVFARGAQCERAVGRHVDGNRMLQVDELQVLMQKADGPRGAVEGVVDLAAAQQRAHHTQIFAELLDLHRLHAHHPHGGMPRPDPQKHAAGCDAVDRGDGMGGDRRDARTGNRHARAEPDPRRVLCGQGKRGVAVRPDHLRVGHPRRVESQVFDVFEDVPVVDFGVRGNAELHGVPPSGCVRRPDVSSAAGGDKSGHG